MFSNVFDIFILHSHEYFQLCRFCYYFILFHNVSYHMLWPIPRIFESSICGHGFCSLKVVLCTKQYATGFYHVLSCFIACRAGYGTIHCSQADGASFYQFLIHFSSLPAAVGVCHLLVAGKPKRILRDILRKEIAGLWVDKPCATFSRARRGKRYKPVFV